MENKYDELLIQGLTKLMDLEFSDISDDKDINYIFSDRYTKNKEMLIKNLGKSYWKFVNTVAKKVAVIIVTMIIAFSSLMTVDAFRKKVVDFVYKIYGIFTEISTNYDNPSMIIQKFYFIKQVPNEYIKISANLNTNNRFFIYCFNSTGQYIVFSQTALSETNQFNSEHGELSEKIINDTPCLVCVDNNLYYCYWEFDDYRFELVYPIDLGEEFMSEVVGNLIEIDPAELEN